MSGSRLLGTSLLLLTATWSSPAIAAAQDTEMAEVNQSENPLLRPFVWRSTIKTRHDHHGLR